jgi:predicted DNA-binding WGR domain protein
VIFDKAALATWTASTSFGDWTVTREWGRRGSPGTLRLDTYQHHVDADAAQRRSIRRRLQRGYQDHPQSTQIPLLDL